MPFTSSQRPLKEACVVLQVNLVDHWFIPFGQSRDVLALLPVFPHFPRPFFIASEEALLAHDTSRSIVLQSQIEQFDDMPINWVDA